MLFTTMQSTFGAYYINDFNKSGRTFKVMMQSGSAVPEPAGQSAGGVRALVIGADDTAVVAGAA